MHNRRIIEYFIVALAIGLGAPVFAVLGHLNGERAADFAYPKEQAAAGTSSGPRDYKDVVLTSAASVEKGQELFLRNCVACHGTDADGQGPGAAGLTPPPRNFVDPKAKWTRGRQPLEIYETLTAGSPGTAMPGFAASLPVADRWAIVHYLASLPGVKDQYQPLDEFTAAAWKP